MRERSNLGCSPIEYSDLRQYPASCADRYWGGGLLGGLDIETRSHVAIRLPEMERLGDFLLKHIEGHRRLL